jgi:hypothetical protein
MLSCWSLSLSLSLVLSSVCFVLTVARLMTRTDGASSYEIKQSRTEGIEVSKPKDEKIFLDLYRGKDP